MKMQTLEELAKNWKKFVFTSIAAASLWTFSTNYFFNDNPGHNKNETAEYSDIEYSYHGADGFEIRADFGGLSYHYTFEGSCIDHNHPFALGNVLHIRNGSIMFPSSKRLTIYDFNCDYIVDKLRTENGTCSASADSDSEMCNQRTYDETNRIFQEGLKRIRFNEFSRKYYQRRFDTPELPEEQTKRLLDGFSNNITQ